MVHERMEEKKTINNKNSKTRQFLRNKAGGVGKGEFFSWCWFQISEFLTEMHASELISYYADNKCIKQIH